MFFGRKSDSMTDVRPDDLGAGGTDPLTVDREERATRLAGVFELQLRFATRMAELTGAPLGEMVVRHTNLHRRFGLGRISRGVSPAWAPYAEGLESLTRLEDRVALTQRTFIDAPPEVVPGPGRTAFGCFACDDSASPEGAVQIHFRNADTDATGGPLSPEKLPRRRGEMAALVAHIRATQPEATHIRGRSWLYNLPAYRRVFPTVYGDTCRLIAPEPVSLDGNSLWGQAITAGEQVRPDVRDAILAALAALDPASPWEAFPFQVLATRAPLESFEAFYRA
ncbi:MAG: hypothetical protein DI570_04390 [Phenylobacterium zucineum]|nr:MAG: hypothetical protein DI570_04390 [Phenylobacterium zucineum]